MCIWQIILCSAVSTRVYMAYNIIQCRVTRVHMAYNIIHCRETRVYMAYKIML